MWPSSDHNKANHLQNANLFTPDKSIATHTSQSIKTQQQIQHSLFISLAGIVVNNNILLIDAYNEHIQNGENNKNAKAQEVNKAYHRLMQKVHAQH